MGTESDTWQWEHCQDPVSEPEDGKKLMKIGGPEKDRWRLIR